jgi:hypothetical protein
MSPFSQKILHNPEVTSSNLVLATKPVMKMAGFFIIVITRSILPLCFLYHLPFLLGIYRKYFT